MRFPLVCILLLLLFPLGINGQQLNHQAEVLFRANAAADTPFWLQNNRQDLIPESSGAHLGLWYAGSAELAGPLDVQWGAELYGSPDESIRTRPLHQLYAGLRVGSLRLRGGMWTQTVGITDPDLSAGPTVWSRNTRPMPKIKIELTDFTSVPFTDDWVQIKGGLSHGWFEGGRPVEDFWLHEKYLYAKLGKSGYPELYAGLIHMGQWGGYDTRRFAQLPDSFRDYWRIFFSREGGEDAPQTWQNHKLGNSLGSWQAGFYYETGNWEVLINKESIFEDGSGVKLRTPEDGVQGINIRYHHSPSARSPNDSKLSRRTNLLSGSPATSASASFTGFTYEFWHTKSQSGPGPQNRPADWEGDRCCDEFGNRWGGRDNYFNHAVYYHGWSYYGRTIGVPFIIHDPETGRKLNNRLIAHHIGFLHRQPEWAVKLLYSWTRNSGTYEYRPDSIEVPYERPLVQQYAMISYQRDLEPFLHFPLDVTAELGLDWGEHTGDRAGALLTVSYRVF